MTQTDAMSTASMALTSRQLTAKEFDALSATSPEGGFQQTTAMMKLAESNGYRTDLVGIVDGGGIQAGAMIVYTPSRFGWEGSIWLGPLCDPHDSRLMEAMTKAIRQSARQHGAISVTCWPDNVYLRHASDGKPDGDPDTDLMTNYARLGWQHAGFTRGYDSIVNRWVYVKDLSGMRSADDLLASYAKNTRRNVKIARNSAVEIRKISRNELDTFHHICELSSIKQHFKNRDLAYFERVYDTFGDKAEFIIAEIHLDRYLSSWQDKHAKFTKEAERLESSLPNAQYPEDVRRKLDTARNNVASAVKRIEDAHERIARDGLVVPAAAGLFIWHARECVYLSSGSDERYAKFYAPTAIQHHVMMQCLERGVTRYNFYGIDGVFDDPDDPGRGVLEFKQGFNGYVEELPGEFTLPVRPVLYRLKGLAHRLLKR